MITIESNAFCCCDTNRSNRYTCPLHCLTLRCPPVRRGDIKVFAFIAPSSNNECLPVMCESLNFESIFRPSAILHPRWRPRPQLHVSLSRRLRHVTKPTVTYMPCNSTASSQPSNWAKFDSASVATPADVMARQTDCATGVRSVRGSGADKPLILSHVTVASLLGR